MNIAVVFIICLIFLVLSVVGIVVCVLNLYKIRVAKKISTKHYLTKSERKHLFKELNNKVAYVKEED